MRRAYGTDELLQRASGLAHRKVVNSGDIPIVFSAILAISSGSDAARRRTVRSDGFFLLDGAVIWRQLSWPEHDR